MAGDIITKLRSKIEELEIENQGLKAKLSEKEASAERVSSVISGYNETLIRLANGDTAARVNTDTATEALYSLGKMINKTAVMMGEISENAEVVQNELEKKLEYMKRVEMGDLTVLAKEDSPNESIAQLGRSINATISGFTEILKKIKASSFAIESSSSEILSATGQLASGLAQEASSLAETTSTFEELSKTAGEIARSASEVKNYAESTLESTNQGNKQVAESVKSMQDIEEVSKKSAQIIVTLSEKSQAINEIIEIINDIAKQTNLLALNASIEAARAGESGKGFSVVASEVGKLAENVKDSAGSIRELINEIQSLTSSSIMTMEEVGNKISIGKNVTQKISEKLNQILDMVQETTQLSKEITLATQQQQTATEQATRAIEEVNEVSRQSSVSSRQTSSTAEDLNKLAQELEEHIGKYKFT